MQERVKLKVNVRYLLKTSDRIIYLKRDIVHTPTSLLQQLLQVE